MDKTRLLLEIKEIHKRFPSFRLMKNPSGLISFQGSLRPRKRSYDILIVLPPTYPHESPRVFPLIPAIRGSKHQYKNGALCYHNTNEWNPRYTICVAIGWVVHWLAAYEHYLRTRYWPGKEAD